MKPDKQTKAGVSTPSPSRGGPGWGWGSAKDGRKGPVSPIPLPSSPLKGEAVVGEAFHGVEA